MKAKSEVFTNYENYSARIKKETGHEINTFRSDNGGEFRSNEFKTYLNNNGIRHETSVPDTPEQNGMAER